jgi:hypothetical protein
VLIREDERGVLVIGQQSHAWLSGQLARAWGNEQFGPADPYDEVCLAAEQHDVGWGAWDQTPLLNPDTGRPRSFMEMPLDAHLELFTDGPRRLISQSRYAALLVSMHGWRLYERRDLDRLAAEQAEAVRSFLGRQEELQSELRAALLADPAAAELADEKGVRRNSMLIWTWDYLSLALCLDWAPATAKRCPRAAGEVDLELTAGPRQSCLTLDPWPFAAAAINVRCEGRRLEDRFDDEQAMREALERAPWETLQFELRPLRG